MDQREDEEESVSASEASGRLVDSTRLASRHGSVSSCARYRRDNHGAHDNVANSYS